MQKSLRMLMVLAAVPLFSGCASIVIGGAATAGYMAAQERGIETAAQDTKLKAVVKANLASEKGSTFTQVGVMVLQGDVLLTGVVKNQAEKDRVAEITRQTPGVRQVFNEIKIGTYGLADMSRDAWISSKVRAGLVSAKDVYSINYMVETVLKHTYIMGIAQNEQERYRVLHIARGQQETLGVYDFIRVLGTDTEE